MIGGEGGVKRRMKSRQLGIRIVCLISPAAMHQWTPLPWTRWVDRPGSARTRRSSITPKSLQTCRSRTGARSVTPLGSAAFARCAHCHSLNHHDQTTPAKVRLSSLLPLMLSCGG